MRVRISTIAADLRRGRHADSYFAAAAALVLGVLGLVGVVDLRWIAPALLLCMVALINLVLLVSNQIEDGATNALVPLTEFPRDILRQDLARKTDLLLVGVTLIRTIRNHESDLRRRLQAGRRVRVLLVDPDDVTAMTLTDRRRQYGAEDAQGNASEVRLTLSGLARLAADVPGNHLEVRTLAFPIGIGGFYISPGRPDARIYVETYPFQTPETQPHFVISSVHTHWFEHFTSELENMWNAGVPRPLDSPTPP